MSLSPHFLKSESKAIPTSNSATRRVFINSPSELPSFYSSTPGGSIYSTTPGGTRIVYDKSTLLNLRNSPISKTPPSNIPEYLQKGKPFTQRANYANNYKKQSLKSSEAATSATTLPKKDDNEDQFQMDI